MVSSRLIGHCTLFIHGRHIDWSYLITTYILWQVSARQYYQTTSVIACDLKVVSVHLIVLQQPTFWKSEYLPTSWSADINPRHFYQSSHSQLYIWTPNVLSALFHQAKFHVALPWISGGWNIVLSTTTLAASCSNWNKLHWCSVILSCFTHLLSFLDISESSTCYKVSWFKLCSDERLF